jgi:hypothetical protein
MKEEIEEVENMRKYEEIEELAFNQTDAPPKKWFRFVDDVFSINFHS